MSSLLIDDLEVLNLPSQLEIDCSTQRKMFILSIENSFVVLFMFNKETEPFMVSLILGLQYIL